jgi:hypothetical protein
VGGYRRGAALKAAWPAFTADPRARFTAYLGYLRDLAQLTVNSATTEDELSNIIDTLAEVQRAVGLRLRAAAAAPAAEPAGAGAGGEK